MTKTPDEARRAAEEAGSDPHAVFWDSAAGLSQILGWARARRAGPYGLLGEVLLRVAAHVPPNIVLPPLGEYDEGSVAGAASLNQIIAPVGPSGMSKGLAHAIAKDIVVWPDYCDVAYAPLGSGEGIAATFVSGSKDKDGTYQMKRTAWTAIMSVTEVDKFAALSARKGATLGGTLRAAWSGEPLGEANASEDKRRYLERHSYRLGLVVHVQPGRGGALLNEDEIAAGTTQRILWLPAEDPDIPDVAPPPPPRIVWDPPKEIRRAWSEIEARAEEDLKGDLPLTTIPVCDRARQEIDRAAVARHRGESGALDGHALLVREKLAATLGIYFGRFGVTESDWELAGHLMKVSSLTRESVSRALSQAAERENDARGRAEAKRARMVRQAETADRVSDTARRITKVLGEQENEGWLSHSSLRRSLSAPQRDYYEDALEILVQNKTVEIRKESKGADGTGGTGISYRIAR